MYRVTRWWGYSNEWQRLRRRGLKVGIAGVSDVFIIWNEEGLVVIWNEGALFMIRNEEVMFMIWNADGLFIIWNEGSDM